jgi:hypothetical protein
MSFFFCCFCQLTYVFSLRYLFYYTNDYIKIVRLRMGWQGGLRYVFVCYYYYYCYPNAHLDGHHVSCQFNALVSFSISCLFFHFLFTNYLNSCTQWTTSRNDNGQRPQTTVIYKTRSDSDEPWRPHFKCSRFFVSSFVLFYSRFGKCQRPVTSYTTVAPNDDERGSRCRGVSSLWYFILFV